MDNQRAKKHIYARRGKRLDSSPVIEHKRAIERADHMFTHIRAFPHRR